MEQALARWQSRIGTGAGADGGPLVDYAAVAFGYQYRSSAVLGAAEDPAPALTPEDLTGQPGTRAPHVTVTRGGREISTIDLYGRRFVLLTGANGAEWVSAAERVAQRMGIPLDAYRFGVDVMDAEVAAHGIGTDGALLVRPDGFVGWRAAVGEEHPERVLEQVLSRLLCREPA
jgi:putative polyketide hydroxylase